MNRRVWIAALSLVVIGAIAAPVVAGEVTSETCQKKAKAPLIAEFPSVASVEVEVVDATTGLRVPGAIVRIAGKIYGAVGRTNARGVAVLYVLRKFLHKVTVQAEGYAPIRLKIRAKKAMPKSNKLKLKLLPGNPA
jgi:hypothetical protein